MTLPGESDSIRLAREALELLVHARNAQQLSKDAVRRINVAITAVHTVVDPPAMPTDELIAMGLWWDESETRIAQAFGRLNDEERHMLTCALAGNFPERFNDLRMPVLRGLAKADARALEKRQRQAEQQAAENVA